MAAEAAGAVLAEQKAQGMDLAAKMMEKMGWKTGLGLGRNKQVWTHVPHPPPAPLSAIPLAHTPSTHTTLTAGADAALIGKRDGQQL